MPASVLPPVVSPLPGLDAGLPPSGIRRQPAFASPTMRHKERHIEQYRPQIEERTVSGESCEAIADALRAQGFEVSSKTISRWRVIWGLRKRASSTAGRKYPDRKRRPGQLGSSSKIQAQQQRRAEITERTQRGETAEEIAAALQEQGYELKAGASTIWRLQTAWKLVPYERDRARGRGKYKKRYQARQAAEAIRSLASGGHAAETLDLGPLLHGTNSAAFSATTTFQSEILPASRPDLSDSAEFSTDADTFPQQPPQSALVDTAAELMSAELLVDLATSTLAAANRIKELYLARQLHRPLQEYTDCIPPTDEEIVAEKQKVRKAAAVMHDLAMPATAPVG